MPVFIVSRCSIKRGVITQTNMGLISAKNIFEAEMQSRKRVNDNLPTTFGWQHILEVSEISKKILEEAIINAE